MFAQDTLIGFINLDSREVGTYTEDYATPIQTFANQTAMAIDKARLFDLEKNAGKAPKYSDRLPQRLPIFSIFPR